MVSAVATRAAQGWSPVAEVQGQHLAWPAGWALLWKAPPGSMEAALGAAGERRKARSPSRLGSAPRSTASLWALSFRPSSGMKSHGPAGPRLQQPLGLPLRPEPSPPSSAARTARSPQPPGGLSISPSTCLLFPSPPTTSPVVGHPRLLPPPLFGVDERGSPAQGQLIEDKGQGGESPTR